MNGCWRFAFCPENAGPGFLKEVAKKNHLGKHLKASIALKPVLIRLTLGQRDFLEIQP